MKKVLCVSMLSAFILAFTFTANANLIVNGDFEGLTNTDINGPEFEIGSPTKGATEEWYALSPWTLQVGGPVGSALYFDHAGGSGSDQRLFQPVDTSAMFMAGGDVTLSFDYLFQQGDWQIQQMGVAIVGLSGTGAQYNAYGGSGFDGYFGTPGDAGDTASARTVLSFAYLGFAQDWTNYSLTTTIDQNYDAILAIFSSSAWSGTGGVRGIDNVSMDIAPVPEPSTILLFGAGILALAGASRRRKA